MSSREPDDKEFLPRLVELMLIAGQLGVGKDDHPQSIR
jgi:hypothetical protein